MSFNFRKLRGRIVEKYGSIREFSGVMEQSYQNISMKLNNKRPWTGDDIVKAKDLLEISDTDLGTYFFTPKV